MLKRLSYIFIFLSVVITVSHSIIAHHHHFETAIEEAHHHHDDNDQHDHSMLSFGQLDENFIFSHSNIILSNDLNTTLFLIPANQLLVAINYTNCRTDFITHQEFPPPKNHLHAASLRGPPTI